MDSSYQSFSSKKNSKRNVHCTRKGGRRKKVRNKRKKKSMVAKIIRRRRRLELPAATTDTSPSATASGEEKTEPIESNKKDK